MLIPASSSLRTLISVALLSSLAAACGGEVDGPSEGGAQPSNTVGGTPTGSAATAEPSARWSTSATGCGDFVVAAVDEALKLRVLVIEGNKERLGISRPGDSVSVALGSATDEASVRLDV